MGPEIRWWPKEDHAVRLSESYLSSPPGVRPFERCCERKIRAADVVGSNCDRPFASVPVSTGWKTSRCVSRMWVVGVEDIPRRNGQVGGPYGDKNWGTSDQYDRLMTFRPPTITIASHFASSLARRPPSLRPSWILFLGGHRNG
jgi:hypothetical protein